MRKFFYYWCAFLVLLTVGCNYFGFGFLPTDTVPNVPDVKSIRNNPAAFRSFVSHGFTGK